MKNRFNNITSKEWLPFQKSWFRYEDKETLLRSNFRFFATVDASNTEIFYYGNDFELAKAVADDEGFKIYDRDTKKNEKYDFVVFDLLDIGNDKNTLKQYLRKKKDVIKALTDIFLKITDRRFVCVLIENLTIDNEYYPLAWDLSKAISQIVSLKDEKIGCTNRPSNILNQRLYKTDNKTFYCLYYRKDEFSNGICTDFDSAFFSNNKQQENNFQTDAVIPSWFILKPQPRQKNEILHPAKYPEELVDKFVQVFTKENDFVFDPMSGTGSTQISALKNKRNAYGTELSSFFYEIAVGRCEEFVNPKQLSFFDEKCEQTFKILNLDARKISKDIFPNIHYMCTSPPYWDMLNVKGAENQAKRIEKGLQTNYSDSEEDLGNLSDYFQFIDELVSIYSKIIEIMEPGSYLTIVVKNIKKKGRNYPFAWDITEKLMDKVILLPENFWCQDDISIAPFGYGNTWVSNTFHQYCLNFQKPK